MRGSCCYIASFWFKGGFLLDLAFSRLLCACQQMANCMVGDKNQLYLMKM